MPRRPTSSAQSSRPFTSGGQRPSTSTRPTTAASPGYYAQDTYYEEEDEEESEAEDVFAYLPPSTGDAQVPDDSPFAHASPFAHDLGGAQYAYEEPARPTTAAGAAFAQYHHYPSHDPSAPSPHYLTAYNHPPTTDFPSPLSPGKAPEPSALYALPTQPYPHPPPTTQPESPPSTSSHPRSTPDDALRMHRLGPAAAAVAATPVSSAHPPSSREVHVSLPPTAEGRHSDEKAPGAECDDDASLAGKPSAPPSIAGDSLASRPRTAVVEGDDASIKMEFDFDAVDEEDSPFPEVRASVSNVDDPEMPVLTIRMWVIGLVLCMAGGAMNVFFNFRSPAPAIVPLVLLLVSYPIGKLAAYALPITTYRIPSWIPWYGGTQWSFNPGPWNIKEHVLVFIMSNVAVGSPYALNVIVVSEKYYGIENDYWFSLVLVLATQLTGFGLAGLCRRFLVWPASMVWPQNLVACTLLNTLHAEDDETTGGITRYRFFMWCFIGSFFWFIIPGYLFQALSVFSWICWIAPNNVPLNQLFGVSTGLGMSFLTFDWTQITWVGSPLMVPWWAQLHIFGGFVFFYWIVVPIFYYTNVWELSHFPISANAPYDRFGDVYNISRVLTKDDKFDQAAYEAYSPLYLSATYAMTYTLAFALSTAVIVHTLLYHGRSLVNGFKRIRVEKDDIHCKLMRNYPEVPDWWYALALVFFFAMAVIAVEVWNTSVPVWALLLALVLPLLYVLPNGFIYAMTGQGITINLLAQILPGTLLPGNPMANMIFKAYSAQTLTAATSFVQDLKLGHYVKVPPRATFLAQMVATILASFIQVAVKVWLFDNVNGICEPDQPSHLTCPHNQVFLTASAVWGLIGPTRQFGKGTLYNPQLYAIAAGAVLPIPFWLWERRRPKSFVRFINTPIIFNGVMYLPPATGINYSSWFLVGFVFQFLIRRRNFAWWSKFNYVTSAALDSGTAVSLIIIFFTLQFPRNGSINVNWWGNNVFKNTADYQRTPLNPNPIGTAL